MQALLLVGVVALVAAQATLPSRTTQPSVPAGTSGLEGRIISTTGSPLPNVKVEIVFNERPGGSSQTTTDEAGRYGFHEIGAGRYVLRVSLDGYVVASTTAPGFVDLPISTGPLPIFVVLEPDAVRRDITVTLARGVTISGRVTDTRNEAVTGVRVIVSSVDDTRIRSTSVSADPFRGDFHLVVPPGEVVVQAVADASSRGTEIEYLATYYPGVTNRAEAAMLRVGSGDVVRGIEIVLQAKVTHTLRGRVASARNQELQRIDLTLSPVIGTVKSQRAKTDGSFLFTNLTPGRYIVSARGSSNDGLEAAWQKVTIDGLVSTQDVDLMLSPSGSLRGRVITEIGETIPLEGARVGAALTDDAHDVDPTLPQQDTVGADGSFSIDGVFGPRAMRVIGLPPGWIVSRVLINGAEVHVPHVTIHPGEAIDNVIIVVARVP